MMTDPKMEAAAFRLQSDLAGKFPNSIVSVGVGGSIIVYVKKGARKPEVPSTYEGFKVECKSTSTPRLS